MQAMCTSFKVELAKAIHNFAAAGGHTFKVALYLAAAILDASTTAYSVTNEVTSANYSVGGFTLTNVDPSSSGTTAMVTFGVNPSWTNVTFTCTQALIYNSTQSGKAVAILDFGGIQQLTAGNFTINLPPVTATTALLRFV